LLAQARAAGYVVLHKPVRPAALRAVIAQLGRRARRAADPGGPQERAEA
jgi:hypothetical protein